MRCLYMSLWNWMEHLTLVLARTRAGNSCKSSAAWMHPRQEPHNWRGARASGARPSGHEQTPTGAAPTGKRDLGGPVVRRQVAQLQHYRRLPQLPG